MPGAGVLTVTVPGVVEGWSELLSKYGTVPMSRVVAPAIEYATTWLSGFGNHQRTVEGQRGQSSPAIR